MERSSWSMDVGLTWSTSMFSIPDNINTLSREKITRINEMAASDEMR